MADVATAAAATTSPVAKKKGRQAAAVAAAKISTPKSPAAKTAKTAKSTTVTKSKIPKVKKTPSDHPPYLLMVTEAISILKDRKGASSQAIFKHISEQYKLDKDGTNHKTIRNRFKTALNKGVSTGVIDQTSGTGANGRFRIPVKPKKTTSDSAPTTPATPAKPKKSIIKKTNKSAPSPSEKKKSPKKVAKPVAKKGKKASAVAKMMTSA